MHLYKKLYKRRVMVLEGLETYTAFSCLFGSTLLLRLLHGNARLLIELFVACFFLALCFQSFFVLLRGVSQASP